MFQSPSTQPSGAPPPELRGALHVHEIERALRRKIFTPAPRLTLSEWADRHRVLSREGSPEPGPWRTVRAPYLKGIMNAWSDPAIEEIVWMKSSQVGATEVVCNALGYIIDQDPGPVLMVEPTEQMAKALSQDRIDPMIKSSQRLRDRMRIAKGGRKEAGDTVMYKRFDNGHFTLATARSAAGLAMRPIRYLFLDEKNRFPRSTGKEGSPAQIARRRTANFWNKKIFTASSPTSKDTGGIEEDFERTNQQHYLVPCPHCRHRQALRWRDPDGTFRVVWDKEVDAHGDEQHKPETAVYVCEACAGIIEESDKQWMLEEALKFENDGWVAARPDRSGGSVVGFAINALYSPWATWAQAAKAWLEAQGDVELLRIFVNTWMGEPFEEGGRNFEPSELAQRCEPYGAEVPHGVGVLTAFVDVQDDRLEVKVKGWGAGEESWLILHEHIMGDPGAAAVWQELDETYLTRAYRHEAGGVIRIRATGIDTGGHHSDAVYRFCRQRKARRIYATKGHSVMHQPIWPTKPPKRPGKGGVRVWMIGTDTAKDLILKSRLKLVDEDGKPSGPGAMHFPEQTPETYFSGLTSEVKKRVEQGGRAVWRWSKLSGRQNEPLDCEVGCLAMLRALGRSVYEHLDREVAKIHAAAARADLVPTPPKEEPNPTVYQEAQLAKKRTRPAARRRTWLNSWRKW